MWKLLAGLEFIWKKLVKSCSRCDPKKREACLSISTPFDVMGAPTSRFISLSTERLNDINESSIVLANANRTLGHAPVSYRAQGTVPSPRASKITLILAISPFPGVVSDLIIEENTNINDLEQFIQKYLMSNIERGTHQ
jgi:hypothetical protein